MNSNLCLRSAICSLACGQLQWTEEAVHLLWFLLICPIRPSKSTGYRLHYSRLKRVLSVKLDVCFDAIALYVILVHCVSHFLPYYWQNRRQTDQNICLEFCCSFADYTRRSIRGKNKTSMNYSLFSPYSKA